MIPGLSKDATIVALIFRDLLAKGDLPGADWEKLYAANSLGLSYKSFKAKIKAELPAYADYLSSNEFPKAGQFFD